MKCLDPYNAGSHLFPCGRCEPCRINRKRLWTNRILLECGEKSDNAFITLSYRDEKLPLNSRGDATLAPEDLQRWLKRIRKSIAPTRIRFYGVGEYGDLSWRPHYHVALFGFPPCSNIRTLRLRGRPMADKCCRFCQLVSSTWANGDVDVGRMEEGSAKYLVGYVLKKMTRFDDVRLHGRMPEFARMSLRPGIGQSAMHDVADVLIQLGLDESEADVPSALRRGKTIAPLGRYLRQQLRLMIGKEVATPDAVLQEKAREMLPLLLAARAAKNGATLKSEVVRAFAQDCQNLISRNKIFGKRGSL